MNNKSECPPIPMSPDHLAQEFAKRIAGQWHYVYDHKKWFHFDGEKWQLGRVEAIMDMARRFCREAIYWPEAKYITESKKRSISSNISSVLELTKYDRLIATTSEKIGLPPPKNKK